MAKPTAPDLGLDPGAQHWQRSSAGAGAIEISFAQAGPQASLATSPESGPAAGARKGEFADAASLEP